MPPKLLLLVVTLTCGVLAVSTAVALDCIGANTEYLELRPVSMQIDGEDAPMEGLGDATMSIDESASPWMRLADDDESTVEVYFANDDEVPQ